MSTLDSTADHVCLIGGAGFIGRSLIERLRAARANGSRGGHRYAQETSRRSRLFSGRRQETTANCWRPCAAAARSSIWLRFTATTSVPSRSMARSMSAARTISAGRRRPCKSVASSSPVRSQSTASRRGEPNENSAAQPFNPYGQTKWEAEGVFRNWQEKDPARRLVIVRPTVVFGPENRGNVYSLIAQLASGLFVMVGDGKNRKSMAFVENVAAFIAHVADCGPGSSGVSVYNYCDKPDFNMNELLAVAAASIGQGESQAISAFPIAWAWRSVPSSTPSRAGREKPSRSARSACRNSAPTRSSMQTACAKTGFAPPYDLREGLMETIAREFKGKSAP